MKNAVDSEQYAHLCSRESGYLTAFSIVKQHNECVSMSERVPENNVFVLVYLKSGYFTDWDILAWQPLPQMPSEVQSE